MRRAAYEPSGRGSFPAYSSRSSSAFSRRSRTVFMTPPYPAGRIGVHGVQGAPMSRITAVLRRLDSFQQRHRWAAFPFAVFKKFGDDQAGNLAALIAYYGFFSLFPLLLVLATVLGFLLHGHADLRDHIVHSTLAQFPIIGDDLKVRGLQGSGLGFVIGLVGTLYGGLGIGSAAQNAMNEVWDVPIAERPGFLPRVARSLLVLVVVGAGILG